MTPYQTTDEDEEQRILEEYLAMNQPALSELAGEPPTPPEPAAPVSAQPSPMMPQAPQSEPEDPLEAFVRMEESDGGRPQIPWSSYDAPPQYKEKDNTWAWVAAALDLALNNGESVPQYVAQLAAPDNSAQANWELRNKAMNDASSRAAQQAQAERARMPAGNDLARQRYEEEKARKAAMGSLDSAETKQWREAAIASGIVTPDVAARMTAEQLIALRPQLGQAVSQQKGFENATKGREQSHSLAVKRQLLGDDLANKRITYQDYLRQLSVIDEEEGKKANAADAQAVDSPAVVQEHSEKYGQELRLRGVDGTEAALAKVEQMLAQYPEGDIPGYGPIDGLKPDALLGEEARAMRAAVMELQDSKLREATGAAAPPSEAKTFGEILGTGLFASEGDLRRGIAQARQKVDEQKGYVAEMYPSARQAGGQARKRAPKPRRQPQVRSPEVMGGSRKSTAVVPADDLEF